jgi:hypothetical protein
VKPSAVSLKQIGIWTGAFERQPASKVQEAGAELEKLGYGAIWFSEGLGREAFTQAALLLAGTSRILVAHWNCEYLWTRPFHNGGWAENIE